MVYKKVKNVLTDFLIIILPDHAAIMCHRHGYDVDAVQSGGISVLNAPWGMEKKKHSKGDISTTECPQRWF